MNQNFEIWLLIRSMLGIRKFNLISLECCLIAKRPVTWDLNTIILDVLTCMCFHCEDIPNRDIFNCPCFLLRLQGRIVVFHQYLQFDVPDVVSYIHFKPAVINTGFLSYTIIRTYIFSFTFRFY